MALDNGIGGDDAMAAEEVTGIGSVRNTFEGGLYGDDSRVKERPTWAIIKMSLLLHTHPLWCSIHNRQERRSQTYWTALEFSKLYSEITTKVRYTETLPTSI